MMMDDLFSSNADRQQPPPFALPAEDGFSCVKLDIDRADGYKITVPNGELLYFENYFDDRICQRSLDYFLENKSVDIQSTKWNEFEGGAINDIDFVNIDWHQDQISMYGKTMYLPRISAWYGDSDRPYSYSGIKLKPKVWNKGLLYFKSEIEKVSDVQFNSVLMNWYRDGQDHISWHTDAEKELGKNPVIASVNFGAERRFLIRRTDDHSLKLDIPLKNGTLLIMRGELQHFWQHAVPKQAKVKDNRFNLTFRHIFV